ncbi:Rieske (2Fe-2S) iron-sulfur domain protein [Stanieria cyanosphaera PCC 7437]|uniref:Rieske (2Fe-2S) iron-sulfur domain protein n=1 Tax=Stanieria cyanosphaera (strain ATCC 29371 / PCC 7437) TaxID=111780 RepID=K9XYB0_STAC7|nr:Rieske 2Fe-2S domain-containing protein [Stanieria cyanosphaera]AFZ37044.1 Rieske (2Fe-2S) iron-sulfur domain protein [Stanieria cyanosphaera PCC 7437]
MSMLEGAPWLLAHKSMLQINKPQKISLYGKDYVIWQDKTGQVNALPNVCPHMGAMLSEGWCKTQSDGTSTVVCPFHALEFDARGCTILPGTDKKTLPQMQPLKLIIKDNFIWSYGDYEPKIPIPDILEKIAQKYEFIGYTADTSVETDLRSMLLIMHDYNHQNGTHRDLFEITEVRFEKFIDNGYHSEAFFNTPTAPKTFWQKLKQPNQFLLPDVIKAHLENYFPSLVIFHGSSPFGRIAQCHIFVPESLTKTRTYILLFGETNNPLAKVLKNQFLGLSKTVVEQDTNILNKIYADAPHKIKLNNEIGMDWVKRNFETWNG